MGERGPGRISGVGVPAPRTPPMLRDSLTDRWTGSLTDISVDMFGNFNTCGADIEGSAESLSRTRPGQVCNIIATIWAGWRAPLSLHVTVIGPLRIECVLVAGGASKRRRNDAYPAIHVASMWDGGTHYALRNSCPQATSTHAHRHTNSRGVRSCGCVEWLSCRALSCHQVTSKWASGVWVA